MGKKRQPIKRGEAVSFRPLQPMREQLELLAERKTRTLADQVEHLIKLGLLVSEGLETDDPDQISAKISAVKQRHKTT
jgi:hypothetical protein